MIDRFTSFGAGIVGATLLVVSAGTASAASLTIVSVSAEIVADPQHLGYDPGYGVGLAGEPFPSAPNTEASSTATTQSLAIADGLVWGPDLFDRTNTGYFETSLTGSATASAISADWSVYASAEGTASPELLSWSDYTVSFTVSEDTTATLDLLLGGSTNFSSDMVTFEIAEMGAVIGFFNAAWSLPLSHAEDAGTFTLNLLAGRTYVLSATGYARGSQIGDTYNQSGSFGSFTLSLDDPDPTDLPAVPVPAPALLLGCGLGAMGLLRRRKRHA